MSEISFIVGDDLSEYIAGAPLQVRVTITEVDLNGDGKTELQVTLDVIPDAGGFTADLRGFFFNVSNDSLLSTLSVSGVTNQTFDTDGNGVPNILFVGDHDNNVNGDANDHPFEAGVEIGTQGAGKDFIPSTSFVISSSTTSLTLDLLEQIGIRATSVGANGGSSKLITQPFAIEGTKFLDANGDGSTVGDSGLGGVTIFVDMDGNGVLSDGDLSTVTADDGTWSMVLSSAQHDAALDKMVFEVLPDGYVQTLGNSGYTLTSEVFTNHTHLDFANFHLFDISGTKWEDKTGDGITNDDTGLGGVTVFIDMDDSGGLSNGDLSTETANDGTWSLTGLGPEALGKTVYEVLPNGFQQTVGADGYVLPEEGGHNQTGLDFANFHLFDISGYKWNDTNGDGQWDQGEMGLSGWTITLTVDLNNDGDTADAGETLTDVTDENGFYEFNNLGHGTYTIHEASAPNWINTFNGATSFTAESGVDHVGRSGVAELLNFGNHELEGPGVRTPGFWSNWTNYWDGVRGDDPKQVGAGDDDANCGFAEHDVLTLALNDRDSSTNGWQVTDSVGGGAKTGLLIGDYNNNGFTDGDEHTIFYSLTEALNILNASTKTQQDARYILDRDVVATWLNHLAGNPIGDKTDLNSPQHYLDQAIDWLRVHTPNEGQGSDSGGDGNLTIQAPSFKVASSAAAWNTTVGGIDAGNHIHQELDSYNNTGTIDGHTYAADGDCSNDFVLT